MFHSRSMLLLAPLLLASACSYSATHQAPAAGPHGMVIGSIQIQLEKTPPSAGAGFFRVDLAKRRPDYLLHFSNPGRPWNRAPEQVRVGWGDAEPFVIRLGSGPASLQDVELSVYEGPGTWLLGLLSAVDGKTIPLGLEFPVDASKITYIGRIRVILPRRLKLFSPEVRVIVEDAATEDRAAMAMLLDNTRLPVETVLAKSELAE